MKKRHPNIILAKVQAKIRRTYTIRHSVVILWSTLALSACSSIGSDQATDLENGEIIPFDVAMRSLVDGLNELSAKDQNFGLLVDEINVTFTLSKTNADTVGVGIDASANSTNTSKFESYVIEKSGGEESTSEGGEGRPSNADVETDAKLSFDNNVSLVAGGSFNASYSSVEAANGSNLINISFKSLANYPVEKVRLLARHGKLGCIAYFAEVLGDQLTDPAATAALFQIIDSDERVDCGNSQVISEIDDIPIDGNGSSLPE